MVARKTWFERFPERLTSETKILKEAGFVLNAGLLEKHRVIAFDGFLPVDPERPLRIVFTSTFPSTPPMVIDSAPAKILRRHHSLSNRQLCLFGFGNARWRADKTSRDVLQEMKDLIEQFGSNDDCIVDDAVPEPITAHLQYERDESIFVPPPISDFARARNERLTGQAEFIYLSRSLGHKRGVVIAAQRDGESLRAAEPYLEVMGAGEQKVKVTVVYVPTIVSADDLKAALDETIKADIYGPKKRTRWYAIVFPEQTGSSADLRTTWVFAKVDPAIGTRWIRTYTYRAQERMARIPQLGPIQEKSVAIVGCGCLGSKIAMNLGASGLGNFVLVDGDLIEPYNSVRQEFGVNSFGLSKVEALSLRLRQLNPEVSVQTIPFDVGYAHIAETDDQIHNALSRAGLIVDTVGMHGISRWLNDFAYETNIPLISASVTNGAWSGEIVRSIPGESACWQCWKSEYEEQVPPGEPSVSLFAPGCNQPTFTGTTYDAEIVASHATSLIVDALLAHDPANRRYKNHYLRWIGRDESGVIGKLDNLPITKREGCPFCNSTPS